MHSRVYDQYLCIIISISTFQYLHYCRSLHPHADWLGIEVCAKKGNLWSIIKNYIQYMQSINSELGGRIQIIETLPGQSMVKSPVMMILHYCVQCQVWLKMDASKGQQQ